MPHFVTSHTCPHCFAITFLLVARYKKYFRHQFGVAEVRNVVKHLYEWHLKLDGICTTYTGIIEALSHDLT